MNKRKQVAEWGEAHRREALRRTYEIAAEMVGDGVGVGRCAPDYAIHWTQTERQWRDFMALHGFAALTAARIDREVRRVRALAEGRLVREPALYYAHHCATGRRIAFVARADAWSWVRTKNAGFQLAAPYKVVRITRIRRPS